MIGLMILDDHFTCRTYSRVAGLATEPGKTTLRTTAGPVLACPLSRTTPHRAQKAVWT